MTSELITQLQSIAQRLDGHARDDLNEVIQQLEPQREGQIYIVHKQIGGYAREDALQTHIVGAYSSERSAKLVAITAGAEVTPITLNEIAPGYRSSMRELGMKLNEIHENAKTLRRQQKTEEFPILGGRTLWARDG